MDILVPKDIENLFNDSNYIEVDIRDADVKIKKYIIYWSSILYIFLFATIILVIIIPNL